MTAVHRRCFKSSRKNRRRILHRRITIDVSLLQQFTSTQEDEETEKIHYFIDGVETGA